MGSLRIVNLLVSPFNYSQARYSSVWRCLSSLCTYNVKHIVWRQIGISGPLIREIHNWYYRFSTIQVLLRCKNSGLIIKINVELYFSQHLNFLLPSSSLQIQRWVRYSSGTVSFVITLYFWEAWHGTWYIVGVQ